MNRRPRHPRVPRANRMLPVFRRGLAQWALIAGVAAALAAGGGAWWWWNREANQTPPRPSARPAPRTAPAASSAPAQPAAPTEPPAPVDLFAVRNWEPPPPPPPPPAPAAPPAPPPKPEPPPLPFKYLGRIIEPDKSEAFLLAQGDRVLAVSVGNVIDGTYKVEKYENGQLYFLYQPMKARQVLAVGTPGNPS